MPNDEIMCEIANNSYCPYLIQRYPRKQEVNAFPMFQVQGKIQPLNFYQNEILITGGIGSGKSVTIGVIGFWAVTNGFPFIQVDMEGEHPRFDVPCVRFKPKEDIMEGEDSRELFLTPDMITQDNNLIVWYKILGIHGKADTDERIAFSNIIQILREGKMPITERNILNAMMLMVKEGEVRKTIGGSLHTKIKEVFLNGVIRDTGFKVEDLLIPGKMTVLDFSNSDINKAQLLVAGILNALLTKRIKEGKREKELEHSPIYFFTDETVSLAPRNGFSLCKLELSLFVRRCRKYNFITGIGTQFPKDLEPNLRGNLNSLFLHRTEEKHSLDELKKSRGVKITDQDVESLPTLKPGECLFLDKGKPAVRGRVMMPVKGKKR